MQHVVTTNLLSNLLAVKPFLAPYEVSFKYIGDPGWELESVFGIDGTSVSKKESTRFPAFP